MRFLVMTDIEGVTGVTTFEQAENSELGRQMLMHDLRAVLAGIRDAGAQAIVYDMHTDGRNVDLSQLDVPVIMGKPIHGQLYRGIGGSGLDGLYLVGLHAMQHVPGALLAHSYLKEYDAIYINGQLVGEIGVEALLAGEQGIPLRFVSGDDMGCAEAKALVPEVVVCPVKHSLSAAAALCQPPQVTGHLLREAACKAASTAINPLIDSAPWEIRIDFSDCAYLAVMRKLHPEIFVGERSVYVQGNTLLSAWSKYLECEKEMVLA